MNVYLLDVFNLHTLIKSNWLKMQEPYRDTAQNI